MAAQNSLQAATQPRSTIGSWIQGDKIKASLMNALCDPREVQKFTSSIVSAVSTNPDLQKCDFGTILSAGLLANSLRLSLSPQLGFCYLVPFKEKAKYEGNVCVKPERFVATFVPGYKGYIQLAARTGEYSNLNAMALKEGELIRYNPVDDEIEIRLIEDEYEREKAKTIGYYASFKYNNGFKKVIYWSRSKMEVHADRYSPAFSLLAKENKKSPQYSKVSFADFCAGKVPEDKMWLYSSFWYKDFDGMAVKTMLRQLLSKWGALSIDSNLTTAIERDGTYSDGQEVTVADYSGMDELHVTVDYDDDDSHDSATVQETKKITSKKKTGNKVEDDFFNTSTDEVPPWENS